MSTAEGKAKDNDENGKFAGGLEFHFFRFSGLKFEVDEPESILTHGTAG